MTVYEYGNPAAEIVLIQPVDEQDLSVIENEVNEIKRFSKTNFYLLAIKIDKWNDQLSPWPAPALFGKDNFGEGAKDTLEEILSLCADKDKTYILGGYSLAGLFALWAAYQTDVFHAVAAASPSIWFLGFVDYMKNSEIKADKIYLSLGDKEEKTRNPVMASVGDCIREANVLLQEKGITTVLEWNQGNHFKDSDIRTAKAFAWVLNLDNSQDGKAN